MFYKISKQVAEVLEGYELSLVCKNADKEKEYHLHLYWLKQISSSAMVKKCTVDEDKRAVDIVFVDHFEQFKVMRLKESITLTGEEGTIHGKYTPSIDRMSFEFWDAKWNERKSYHAHELNGVENIAKYLNIVQQLMEYRSIFYP